MTATLELVVRSRETWTKESIFFLCYKGRKRPTILNYSSERHRETWRSVRLEKSQTGGSGKPRGKRDGPYDKGRDREGRSTDREIPVHVGSYPRETYTCQDPKDG